jgi:predicted chitinase
MQRTLDAFNRAQAARSEAFQLKTDAERRQAELLGEIAGLTAERDMAGANTAASNEKQTQIAKKYAELIQVRETLQVATKADTTGIVVSTTSTVEVPAVVTAAVAAIERKVNAAMLTSVFPERARNNIQTDVKYLAAAMKEAQIADARVAAVIIATIAVETPNFEHYEEPQNRFNTKDQPFDLYEKDGPIGKALGNNEPGDGARFRGRGYIGLTGRANYSRMAIRLGVDLVNNPDLAKNPDVASRVVCAYFTDRLARVTDALDRNDLAAIRRVVNGGAHGLDEFVSAYNKVLSKLNG